MRSLISHFESLRIVPRRKLVSNSIIFSARLKDSQPSRRVECPPSKVGHATVTIVEKWGHRQAQLELQTGYAHNFTLHGRYDLTRALQGFKGCSVEEEDVQKLV